MHKITSEKPYMLRILICSYIFYTLYLLFVYKQTIIALGMCIFLICVFIIEAIIYLNITYQVKNTLDNQHDKYQKIHGLVGAEDMVIAQGKNIFISCDQRYELLCNISNTAMASNCGIFVIPHMQNIQKQAYKIWTEDNFHPHGIDYYIDEHGTERLFVINHTHKGDEVLIFDITYPENENINAILIPELKLIKRIEYTCVNSFNDLTAVSLNTFYITADHGCIKNKYLNRLSDYLRWHSGNIYFYNGDSFEKAITGMQFPNGIAISKDKKYLYVASMLAGSINVYERKIIHDIQQRIQYIQCIKINTIQVKGKPDNITLYADNSLLVAVHCKILHLAKQRRCIQFKSPSTIQYIKNGLKDNNISHTIFEDNGNILSSASIAMFDNENNTKNNLYVGSIYDTHILRIEI
jgi:arylesterase / paraoxonase